MQGGTTNEKFDNIILPFDRSKETKRKLSFTAYLAMYFSTRVHVVLPSKVIDEHFMNQLIRNVNYAKTYLKEKNVPCTVHLLEGKESFADKVTDYTLKEDGDLIVILNQQSISIVGESYEQKMLANKGNIPVMCVNPQMVMLDKHNYMVGT